VFHVGGISVLLPENHSYLPRPWFWSQKTNEQFRATNENAWNILPNPHHLSFHIYFLPLLLRLTDSAALVALSSAPPLSTPRPPSSLSTTLSSLLT